MFIRRSSSKERNEERLYTALRWHHFGWDKEARELLDKVVLSAERRYEQEQYTTYQSSGEGAKGERITPSFFRHRGGR